jgi:hypothetical protein
VGGAKEKKMTVQAYPNLRFLNRIEQVADLQPEGVDASTAQEQFNGVIPLRNERPMAELLVERQADADPTGTFLLFIP